MTSRAQARYATLLMWPLGSMSLRRPSWLGAVSCMGRGVDGRGKVHVRH
jgi:hypothetical protein